MNGRNYYKSRQSLKQSNIIVIVSFIFA